MTNKFLAIILTTLVSSFQIMSSDLVEDNSNKPIKNVVETTDYVLIAIDEIGNQTPVEIIVGPSDAEIEKYNNLPNHKLERLYTLTN